MSIKIELRTPSKSDRQLIRRMMELYLYDFSEFDAGDLDEHGTFGHDTLDYFWFEPSHAAFVIWIDGKLAGFVLVNHEVVLARNERSIAEFFILRKYRRQGAGAQVACQVFDLLPGRWEVRVIEENTPAQAFWRKTIAKYTRGIYQETQLATEEWAGPAFSFDNRR